MRRLLFAIGLGLMISSLAQSSQSADAATIEGRVVDSDGKPLARAEVRMWQKIRGAAGRSTDRQVEFNGREALLTDADGRFVSPNVLVSGLPALIVAEQTGMVAGRSGWIRIPTEAGAVKAPDITLKGLRFVFGRVLDRHGEPVGGATVFTSGDGHERVETRSKGGGKFLLTEVPKGGAFLFAEKPGYRFSGLRLADDRAEATLVLTSVDEPAESKSTLAPLVSSEEEYGLARAVLDPWLERLAKSGTPDEKVKGFASLIQINGLEAMQRLDWLAGMEQPLIDIFRYSAVCSVIAHHQHIARDQLAAMIEAGGDEYQKAAELVRATDEMGDGERATRLEWLEVAARHARKVNDPPQRARVLASVAERFFANGQVTEARQVLTEAENVAKPLFPDYATQYASFLLALAAAHDEPDRAVAWLDKAGGYLKMHGCRLAIGLLPDHPRQAVEVWNRVAAAMRAHQGRTSDGIEYRAAARFFYRLALVDRARAEQLATDADEAILRFRAKGAIFLALAQTQPVEARRLLAALVREELPQLQTPETWLLPMQSAPAIAAWLLPVAEQVAPDLCGELFWRSLALRPSRPRRVSREHLFTQVEDIDFELAKLLSRYDRDIARALLEPPAANAFASGERAQAQILGGRTYKVFLAAIHVDPRWAKSLLDAIADSPASIKLADSSRYYFVCTLALPLPERWNGLHEYCAGFWEPSARDRPLPP